ncbi:MAG: nucleoside-diphosphate kinase [Bacteroidales bacterium]|nr:nucleoside-diphosphate kinase [Bacteroidales bacterium]MDD4216051.1 nucleoside-diphosphate kinase [Bacteroidales bacterium]MDY0140535.1 nucleoside-diphosphate kinase [Bacteroidales bacterium]
MKNREFTFTMIKPTAIRFGKLVPILDEINHAGFAVIAMKMTRLSKAQAEKFYAIHKERPFFEELVSFMSSGPVLAAVLQKENAVQEFRKLIGNTNPQSAEEGTIRKKFAISIQENAIHGSDSDQNALIETNFFFNQFEIFSNNESFL